MYFAAAMAIGSMISAHEQRKAQMKAKAADAKLQRARLEQSRLRATEDYETNTQRAREAALQREAAIESRRLDAEAGIDKQFAGSGIGGQSVNEIDTEVAAAVAKDKFNNKKSLEVQLSDMARDYSLTMSDSASASQGIDTTRVKGTFLGDAMTGASAFGGGLSVDQSMGFSFSDGKYDFNRKT